MHMYTDADKYITLKDNFFIVLITLIMVTSGQPLHLYVAVHMSTYVYICVCVV